VNPIQSGIFVFQYDYDSDGMNELVLATADGFVIFVKNDGSFLEGETFKVGQGKQKIFAVFDNGILSISAVIKQDMI